MAPSERGQSCPLSTRLLREGLLRFAGGVPAPTRLLAVGACGRSVLLPAHVNRRLLTGTRATAASGLRIFFRSCHINLHEMLDLEEFSCTEHATARFAPPLSRLHADRGRSDDPGRQQLPDPEARRDLLDAGAAPDGPHQDRPFASACGPLSPGTRQVPLQSGPQTVRR